MAGRDHGRPRTDVQDARRGPRRARRYLGDGPVKLGFQRVEGYTGPGWPDPAKHAHLDFTVTDLGTAVSEAVALGASRPDYQPGGDSWVVLTDPEGHTFCLATED